MGSMGSTGSTGSTGIMGSTGIKGSTGIALVSKIQLFVITNRRQEQS